MVSFARHQKPHAQSRYIRVGAGRGPNPKNPANKAELPRLRKASERFLKLPECHRSLAVAGRRDGLILRLFLVCGLRPSELFALRVD